MAEAKQLAHAGKTAPAFNSASAVMRDSHRQRLPALKRSALAVALALLPGAGSALAANCTLTINGDWGTPANWSCAVRPGTPNAADTATVNVGGIVAVSQSEQIAALANAGIVNINAGLLAILGGGVVNNGTINVANATRLDSRGSNAFTGTGTVSMVAGSQFNLEAAGTTSIGTGSTLGGAGTVGLQQFAGGAHVLSVLGVVSANVAGGTLLLQPTAGTSNAGVLEARNGGTLQLNTAVTQTGAGRIDALAGSVVLLNNTSISGGVVNTSGSGVLRVTSSGNNLLSGVTVNGNVDVTTANAYVRVSNGLVLNGTMTVGASGRLDAVGTQTLSGPGTLRLDAAGARFNLEGADQTTIAANLAVNGQGTIGLQQLAGGSHVLVNNSTISANVSGGTLDLRPSGGTVNNGVLEARNGGTLDIRTGVSGAGQINALDTSVVQHLGSVISGNTIGTSGSGVFRPNSSGVNLLSGVTVAGAIDMVTTANSRERIGNGLTLNGAVITIGNGGILSLDSLATAGGNQTVGGTGTIVLADGSARISQDGPGNSTIGANVVVRGQGDIGTVLFSGAANNLIVDGRISADVSGAVLNLARGASAGALTNNGILEATAGGILRLSTDVTGTAGSQIRATAGSRVEQNGVTVAGIVNTSGGGVFTATSSGANVLSGVTLNGTLDLSTIANSRERVIGGLVLNGAINIANGGILSIDNSLNAGSQSVTTTGSATINLNDAGARLAIEASGPASTVTLGSNVTVRGQGNIGQPLIVGGAATLINNGVISADVAAGTLNISPIASTGGVVNNGTLQAVNGGLLLLSTNITANPGSQILAGPGSEVRQNGVTVSGVINTSGGGVFTASSNGNNVLSGVTLNGTLDLATIANSRERVIGGLVLNGAINIANGGILSIDNSANAGSQSVTTTASATINLNDANARLAIEASGPASTVTLGSNVTVRGQGNIGQPSIVGGAATLINDGVISADVNGGTLNISAIANVGGVVNNGTLQAVNGGLLLLSTGIVGNPGGQILASSGSEVRQNGVTVSGVINTSGGGLFTASSSSANVLDAVSLNGTLDLAAVVNARERVVNGLTLNGAINIANGGFLLLDSSLTSGGNQTIGGTGTINLNAANARLTVEGAGETTLGANITVRGQGNFGQAVILSGNNTLINNGLVSADVSGGTLAIVPMANGGAVTNNGVFEARAGGTLSLDPSLTFNNALGGQIVARTGGVVLQNGAVVSGGTIASEGTGVFRIASNGANVLSGVTVSGTIDLTSIANGRLKVANGLTFAGAGRIDVGSGGWLTLDSSRTAGGSQTIGGAGTINLNDASARITVEDAGATTLGPNLTVRGQGFIGQGFFVSGNNALTNQGTILADGGTLTIQPPANSGSFTNAGLMHAQNGTLAFTTALLGAGTLQVSGTGQVNLSNVPNFTGTLIQNGTNAGSLNVGNQALTVSTDYQNASFGTGNAFNRRANVTGAGAINAAAGVIQTVTGNTVTNGSTATPTLIIGNVRVGAATTYDFQVGNSGTGPALRGAVQTSVNGGNLTDGQLALSGGNFGPASTQTITVTPTGAGLITLAPNQRLALVNNFDNTQGQNQVMSIVAAAGAAAYNAAQGSVVTPVTVANQRTGGTNTTALAISNVAPTGAFTEVLNASFGAATGNATNSGTAITGGLGTGGVAAGSSNAATMQVGVDTSQAGARSGTQVVSFQSNGTGTSGLGTIGVGSQVVAVSGNVFQAAQGTLNTAALNFGTVQVGQSVSQVLSITNSATGPAGFVEDLAAAFGTRTDARISGTGSISGLLAGQTNAAAMTVSVNTAAAGSVNGSILVNYTSAGAVNGVSNGLGTLAVGSSSFGVVGTINANVVNTAAPVINTAQPINLGNLRQGSVAPTATVSVTNQLTTAPQAALNATIAGNGNVTGTGSFNLLAPGGTDASALRVGLANTGTAGFNTGNATIAFVSDASNIGNCAPNCQFNLASQNVTVNANIYRLANPVVNTGPIVLAARVGGAASQAVSISNASVDAFTEGLNVTRTGTAAGFTSAGSVTNLAAQGTSSAITVALDTAAAGTFNGNQSLGFVSTGVGTTGAADVAASTASADVSLTGRVYTPAVANVAPSVNFGIVRVGDVVAQRGVSVANSAAVTALNDTLSASIGGTAGVFTNNGGNVNGLVAGGAANTSALTVGLNTASAGVFNGSATVAASSRNPDLADLSLGTSNVVLTGQVNNLAQAAFRQVGGAGAFSEQAGNTFTLDFGDIAQGSSAMLTARLAAWNRAPAGAPSDDLKGSYSGADDTVALSFSGFNAFAQLGTDQTGPELLVNLFNTANLGLFTQTILLSGFSFNAFDLDGLGTNATLFVRANVIDGGGTSVIPLPPAGWLLLGGLAMMGWMGRRRTA